METEKMVKVTIFKDDQWTSDWPSENLAECIAWLNEKLGQIPIEYRAISQIEIESRQEYGRTIATIEIFYLRNLTAAEKAESITD